MQKESNDSTLGVCIVPKESHGCTGLHSRAISSKTNHHLFSLQNSRLILMRVMGEHLVKVMGLMRVMCGTRVTLLSFGTREYVEKCHILQKKSLHYTHSDAVFSTTIYIPPKNLDCPIIHHVKQRQITITLVRLFGHIRGEMSKHVSVDFGQK